MSIVTYTEARENLATILDTVESDRVPVEIHRRGHEPMVLLPASELAGLTETAHLLRSPKNAARLAEALKRTRAGKGKRMNFDVFKKQLQT